LLCCCSSCSCGHINQNTELFSNFTMLSAYCTIAMQPCLARQPYPAALPGNLVDLVALHGSLARQCCTASLPGSLAEILQV
jgi:hypothetical protein